MGLTRWSPIPCSAAGSTPRRSPPDTTYAQYEGPITSKTTIVTEEGWTTGGTNVAAVTTAQQVDNVDAAYWAAKDVSYLPIVTWFQLRDNPAANLYHGLYTST